MPNSMTGFGHQEFQNDDYKLVVEMRSVNHRYLDLSVRLPKQFNCFEPQIRSLLKKEVRRGKLDISVYFEDFQSGTHQIIYNPQIAEKYLSFLDQMSDTFRISNDVTSTSLSRYPDVFTLSDLEINTDKIWKDLQDCLSGALKQLQMQRKEEGQLLMQDLLSKLDFLESGVHQIEERSPQIVTEYRTKLYEKLKEVLEDSSIEESRILQESILYSDKICTDEETVRLLAHITSMRTVLSLSAEMGRKLDFIAQEMNREANTILSKANDLTTSRIAIDLKTEIEKIREQIQNIE